MDFTLRAAVPADARAIAEVRVQGWRQTYAHFLSAGLLDSLDPTATEGQWRDIIEMGWTFVVVEVAGEVQGFAMSGPPAEDDAPRDLELGMIYQLATLHGSGSGQALLDATIGREPAFLWTAELNPRAQSFYRRNGFALDGARRVAASWENLAEVRMVR